jgi:hypothetical protein
MAGKSLIAAPLADIEVSISGPSVQRVITTTSLGPHIRSADVTRPRYFGCSKAARAAVINERQSRLAILEILFNNGEFTRVRQ